MTHIIEKTDLNKQVFRVVLDAPLIARKASPGQFVIVRVDDAGERIPLTISDYDREKGTITLVVQVAGATTLQFSKLNAGDVLADVVGPLGKPTELNGIKRAAVIGGGVGCAIAYPVARELSRMGAQVDGVIGFRNRELVILENEFEEACASLHLMTDDGSAGDKGLVTDALKKLIESGVRYDRVFAIGPLVMMKFVSALTREYGIPTVVSMNPIMIDGTGMCGGCRLTVGGKMCFACIDGPDFDGHQVDFDEMIMRSKTYADFEKHAYEEGCNLFAGRCE
ncbi:MAG: sulfide/dihydroorotate dehydrogenase-like FAD/NAD-binding protein [Clostridiales bacterium]|nr:sulfide/dihydroorotate dehydrogenase-like FAD/NAD-binding protein [Clostridiales bacterium]